MITLREVNKGNWQQIVKLKVSDEQQNWVAPNWYSLLQNHYEAFGTSRAIYADDTPVGFVWYGKAPKDGRWWINRLMTAAEHQGKGYGRTAMLLIIGEMRQNADCQDIYISFVPTNAVARRLYESIGFVDTGTIEYEETVFVLPAAT
jgi:diamine N-acetyltransferase